MNHHEKTKLHGAFQEKELFKERLSMDMAPSSTDNEGDVDKQHQLDAIDPEPAWRADTVRPRVAARGLFDTEPGGSPGDPVIDLRDRIAIQIAFIANRPLLAARRAGRELCDTRTRADVSPCRAMRGARQTDRRPRSPTSPRPRPQSAVSWPLILSFRGHLATGPRVPGAFW